ncbi:MAG: glycerol uptake facilitator protein [Solirubrobacteraceae bacterium]|jgi:glycerol uptake facilitator protein|nr:glycerol uptake facilitator protein [Solirubrobacteraceae bacterium]
MAAAADRGRYKAGWRTTTAGELVSEWLGTFIIICFGDGVVAMAVAALNQSGRGTKIFDASGDWLLIGWGWGFAVTFAVYVAGGVSGAHLNPAVTVALAARRGFPARKVPSFVAAQVFGAFCGALLVYVVYKAAIDSYERVNHITRGQPNSVPTYSIFATFPAPYFKTIIGPLVDQIVGTAFLVGFIFAVTDDVNQPARANLAPVVVGFIVVAVGLSFGANAGYAINPARDFGPRVFAWIAGYGKVAMPGNYGNISGYLWIPIVGPLIGGLVGAYVYDFAIRDTLIARGEVPAPVEEQGRTVQDNV